MGIIKRIIRRTVRVTSEDLLTELKKGGAEIGKGVIVFDPNHSVIDGTRPWLLKIGSYTKITRGVVILTHDYSLSVMRRVYGEWIGEGEKTIIGDNCFLGINSIVLMGSQIGNNVIVGAGSVVHGKIPDNVVVAGNPAKIIATLDEHFISRKAKTVLECKNCIKNFYYAKGKMPQPKDLAGFKFLFSPRDKKIVNKYGLDFYCNGDEPEEVEKAFFKTEPHWPDFDSMIKEVEKEIE